MALTTWDEQEVWRSKQESIAKNGARIGQSIHRVGSRGAGETHIVQPLPFQVTFVAEPAFTSGLTLSAGKLISGLYPIASVGVYKWQTDSRGFYIGAYVWVAVTFGPAGIGGDGALKFGAAIDQIERALSASQVTLDHHLVFEGMALRDINVDAVLLD